MMGYGMMSFGMWFFMLLWWGVIIAGIFLAGYGLIQLLHNKKPEKNTPGNVALEQLKIRYAAGEISLEEYNERRQVLLS